MSGLLYVGDDFGIDANDLMQALANFFLQSGFNNPYMQFSEWDSQTLEDLKRAIQEALESGQLRLSRGRVDVFAIASEVVREARGLAVGKELDVRIIGEPTFAQLGGPRGRGLAGARIDQI